jgi:TfoX/Sxy family transcriptional regulator of competence genes
MNDERFLDGIIRVERVPTRSQPKAVHAILVSAHEDVQGVGITRTSSIQYGSLHIVSGAPFNKGYWSGQREAPIRGDLCRLATGLAHSLREVFATASLELAADYVRNEPEKATDSRSHRADTSERNGMNYDEKLAARIRRALAERSDVVEKKMFGDLCFMVNGAMCCGLTKSDLMVRVGRAGLAAALSQPHARPMDFAGRALSSMVYVSPAGLKTEAALQRWVRRGVAFVESSPKSKPRARAADQSDGKRLAPVARARR